MCLHGYPVCLGCYSEGTTVRASVNLKKLQTRNVNNLNGRTYFPVAFETNDEDVPLPTNSISNNKK